MTAHEERRQQWQERIAEYQASGLTLKAWCAAHDCTVDQMKYWLYKSKKSDSSTPVPAARFIPLTVADEVKSPPLLLRIGHAQIELRSGFDPQLLRDVVHVLTEAASC
ncbi:IS66 family insertion sequence element accessory protein TnpA [Paenibacillus xylaniclasticus]|uniref:IS66 family insertion sequence element accessory protein TnpA n=1 Tax=Paenibacillus xylaniclasticus TaxID=588083 RepID=UPI000FDB8995|nr:MULTISPECIES: hypothetical protein [Paenibacillus]GFN33181.1 hypothetical protein PCURB6_34410 [Paenibacillus curdlanolyticus]